MRQRMISIYHQFKKHTFRRQHPELSLMAKAVIIHLEQELQPLFPPMSVRKVKRDSSERKAFRSSYPELSTLTLTKTLNTQECVFYA